MHSWIGCCRRLFWSRCFGFLFQGDFLWSDLRPAPQSATPSLCEGATYVGAVSGCAVELALRCARRSDNHGESDYEACALRCACSPRNRPAAGAAGRGGTGKHPNSHTGHCFARPSFRSAWRLRPRGGAGRSAAKEWPVWMFAPQPLCMRRGAQWAGWHVCRRTHMLRGLVSRVRNS